MKKNSLTLWSKLYTFMMKLSVIFREYKKIEGS